MVKAPGPARWALLLVTACASSPQPEPRGGSPEAGCRTRLTERSGEIERLPAERHEKPGFPSRIVTHAELRSSRLKDELERKIGTRLQEARGVDIGVAGSLNYTVDRGPLRLSVEGQALVVQSTVSAHAEACSRGRCYASCDPIAVARAEVPLQLDASYGFRPSRVTATFTRGCKVRALRGFLTIDVTPTLQAQLAPALRRVEREIDGQLPRLRPQAERLWAELSAPRALPLGGCVVVQPRGIVQGPVQGNDQSIRLRFGLLAEPEIRARCGEVGAASALPPLAQDPTLGPDGEVRLGLVSPLAGVASALRAAEGSSRSSLGIEQAAVSPAGRALDADLTLKGEVCGDLSLRALPAWREDGRSLELSAPRLAPEELRRVSAASLEPEKLASRLAAAPRIALPLDPQAIDELVPLLASSQSDADFDVSASISSVQPLDAAVRSDDVVAWLRVKGRLELRQK